MKLKQIKAILLMIVMTQTISMYCDAKTLTTQEKLSLNQQILKAVKDRDEAAKAKNKEKFDEAQLNFLKLKSKLYGRS